VDLPSEERAYQAASRLARSAAPPNARLLTPIPVRAPEGVVESWFVPVAVGDQLVAYVRVGRGGPSYSALGKPQPLAAWIDEGEVRRIVEQAGYRPAGTPYLGYDGAPARLAWMVPLVDEGTVCVAGGAVWRSSPAEETM
jgi:hypothetical protein